MPRFGPLLVALLVPVLLTACYPVHTVAPVQPQQDAYLLRSIEVEPRVQTVSVPKVEHSWASYVTARVDVMIRKGPGKSYKGCGHLPKGNAADLIECQGNWCKIRYNGQEGWSHSRYLDFHSRELRSQAPVQQVVEPGYRVDYVVPLNSPASYGGAPVSYYPSYYGYPPAYGPAGHGKPVVYWSTRPPLAQGAWWERLP